MALDRGPDPVAPSSAARVRVAIPWAIAAGAAAVALLLAVFAWRGPRPRETSVVASILPPLDAFDTFAPALAPEGSRLVFVARDSGGTSRLWIRELDAAVARAVAGTEGASYPFWSPDSRAVAFFAGGQLHIVNPWDGAARAVAPAPAGRGGTWSQDGTIVFAPAPESPLLRVAAAGGTPQPVTRLDAARGELAHQSPVFLPDGQRFLYRARGAAVDRILAGSIESLDSAIVTDAIQSPVAFAASGHLLFRRDGALMAQPFDSRRLALSGDARALAQDIGEDSDEFGRAFSVSNDGVLIVTQGRPQQGVLTWIDRAGRQREEVGEPAEYVTVALSSDGTRVATDRRDPDSGRTEIWVIDMARRTQQRLTPQGGDESDPIWSADGAWLAFSRRRQQLVRRALATGAEETLVGGDHRKYPTGWSSADHLLFFDNDPVTQGNVWALPLSGDRTPVMLVGGPAMEGEGVVSPDGRWLAYDSNESGRYEVYIRPVASPDPVHKISAAGGWSPKWRHDGRELFFQAEDRPAIMAAAISTAPALQSGTPVQLFGTSEVIRGYDVAADGQRFLLNLSVSADRAAAALTMILNWPGLLQTSR
jgi:Tol biopolymer transport system component